MSVATSGVQQQSQSMEMALRIAGRRLPLIVAALLYEALGLRQRQQPMPLLPRKPLLRWRWALTPLAITIAQQLF
ncbi:MAG: hypothetical protein JWP47_2178 [Polaromonas sp.]|jgi:hypothetical protein|nr:hypothetical protein [Polaromonas sp.]